eukprot:COSAG06_NODE_618_length_13744_cov_19.800220_4_plen_470_part_00
MHATHPSCAACLPACPPVRHSNWDGCEYQYVCDLIQTPNFSFQNYAKTQNLSFGDLTNTMRPLFYASSVSCMSTGLMIAGGSNLAKFMYYKNVLSRREEATAKRQGGDSAGAIRRNALEKKVRQTRQKDIKEVSGEMVHNGVTKLEENALVMEFATGVPMEEHYDLVAHDDIMAEVEKAADRERLQGNAGKGVRDLTNMVGIGGDDGLDMELDMAKVKAAGGAVAAGGVGAAALKEASQLKQLKTDLEKITAKLETARATMEGRVPDVQGQLNALKEKAGDAQGQAMSAVDGAKAKAQEVQAQAQAKADEAKAKAEDAQAEAEKMKADMEEMSKKERKKMKAKLEEAESQAKTMQEQAEGAVADAQAQAEAAAADVQAQAEGAAGDLQAQAEGATGDLQAQAGGAAGDLQAQVQGAIPAMPAMPGVPAMPTAAEMEGMSKQQKKEAQKAAKAAQKQVGARTPVAYSSTG